MSYKILLVKETRAGETRVGLTPGDVKKLVSMGHKVFVEGEAGNRIGVTNDDYIKSGAEIKVLNSESISSYRKLFDGINFIVRVKRPDRRRELLENQTINSGTIMVGVLDAMEKGSKHIGEYHKNGILAYSIDQLDIPSENPMNILTTMSKIAGKLAVQDAISKYKGKAEKIIIIGYGIAGKAASDEGIKQNLNTTVILRNKNFIHTITDKGCKALILNMNDSMVEQQNFIKESLLDTDIVITCARKPNQPAPILINKSTLECIKKGTVIVDLALTEGGNVEGSQHDKTLVLGNDVIVTNTSGYPKAYPKEASTSWSKANLEFIINLEKGFISLKPC